MARLLSERGLEERLVVAFAGWLVPLGHGDGESHLVAGLRVCSAIDAVEARGELDGTAFFGHHGSGRNGRALGTTFSRESRDWLKSAVDGLLQPDYLAARTAILDIQQERPKDIIGRKALEKILTPLAAAAAPFVPVLAQAGLPTAAELRNPEYKALNGSASIVEVRDDGLWERGWRLSPQIREGKEKFTMPINFSFGPYTEQPPFK